MKPPAWFAVATFDISALALASTLFGEEPRVLAALGGLAAEMPP